MLGIAEKATIKANNTTWEELSLSFTPTKKGVSEIYLEGWYVAGVGNIYSGEITIT